MTQIIYIGLGVALLFSSKKVIGLDIGSNTIKMAELQLNKQGAELLSFAITPTPVGSMVGGEINGPDQIAAAVQALIQSIRSKRKMVSLGVWGTAVIVKKITIPKMDVKLIPEQLKWEAEQYVPFDIKDVSLAHYLLKGAGSSETMDILLIAARNEILRQYNLAINQSRLQTSIVDVSGFALANCFELNYGLFPGETVALLNFGSQVTNFVVIQDGQVVFCRDVPVGGMNYSQEIQKEMGVSYEESEVLKISAVNKGAVPDEVHSILNSTNQIIADEIRSSFDFFNSGNSGAPVSRCYFTGGTSFIPNLMGQVSSSIGVQMELFNPFLKIKYSKKLTPDYISQISSFAPVAIGLGVRQVGDS